MTNQTGEPKTYADAEGATLRQARQADISSEALQAGFEATILSGIVTMGLLEVANILIGSKLPIPQEWLVPAFLAVQFPEVLLAGWVGLQVGFFVQDERSIK